LAWRWVLRAFNDFIRGTPVLIQLFFVYFGSGQIGLNLSPITAAVVTLTINASAYMAEVVRSGLMSVDPGQSLAARALGLTRVQTFTSVVWPQAFRIAMPPLMNSVVALLKDTALISVISVGEVVREAQAIISVTFNPMKYYLIVAVMFFIVAFPLMKLADRLERTIRRRGFAHD
jgi:ABC-type amino acid transport system permease subunit